MQSQSTSINQKFLSHNSDIPFQTAAIEVPRSAYILI